jgi:TRAP-type mannitol/chloroaromatic compound transport system permease small subunit
MSDRLSWLARVDEIISRGILHKLTQAMAWLGGGCVIALMMIATISIFGRRISLFAGGWLAFTMDYSQVLIALAIGFTVAYAWYRRGHVRIGIIYDSVGTRAKDIIDLASALVGCCVYGFVAWAMWPVAMNFLATGRRSFVMGVPEAPFIIAFAFAFTIFGLVLLRSVVGLAIKLSGRHIERGGLY